MFVFFPFLIPLRRHSVCVYGDIKEYDGAVERPVWGQLLQGHSDPQELPRSPGLRPVQWQYGDGLCFLTVTKHGVHHAAGGHGQRSQCPQQCKDRGDNRSVTAERDRGLQIQKLPT